VSTPQTPYDLLGGAPGVLQLVTRFYDHMSELTEAQAVLGMHPEDLAGSREKLFEFLSGWLGGPPLYIEKRGHPRLRMRHMPFAIDDAARDAWLLCMQRALEECVSDDLLRDQLMGAFRRMASHLRNAGPHQRPEDVG
jgi:hemoglobin